MKKVLFPLLIAGALFGGYFYWTKVRAQEKPTKAYARPTTAAVEQRDISFAINSAGDIGPAEQVSVRPEVSGKIAELPVDIGDQIQQGGLLFRLDDQDLQTERATQLTQIEGAKLSQEKAKRNFERSKNLFDNNLISREAFDDSRTDYALSQNALDRAEKALRQVEDKMSKTRINAPFDCTVLTRPVSMGQAVSGSGGVNSGTEVLTIANLKEMVINAHINQADVIRLSKGQKVDIQVESVPGLEMKGTIDRIAPQATVKNNIKGFSARVLITAIDPRVRPGMTANLAIPVSSAENVLAVPLGAVFTDLDERYVYLKKEMAFERRPVKLGVTDSFFAEITDGLMAGDVISLEAPKDSATATGDAQGSGPGGGPGKGGSGKGKKGGPGAGPGGGGGGKPKVNGAAQSGPKAVSANPGKS